MIFSKIITAIKLGDSEYILQGKSLNIFSKPFWVCHLHNFQKININTVTYFNDFLQFSKYTHINSHAIHNENKEKLNTTNSSIRLSMNKSIIFIPVKFTIFLQVEQNKIIHSLLHVQFFNPPPQKNKTKKHQ